MPVHMVNRNGEELNAKERTEFLSSPQPQGLSVNTEEVTTGCCWKDYFGQRSMQAFEMLPCMAQHLPAELEQGSHFIPK